MPWKEWVGNYALVRDAIEATFPDDFRDFNARLDTPGGFPRPIGARERRWDTDTGRANFVLPRPFDEEDEAGVLRLMTLRSNDQFNTTIYGMHDRFRGLHGSRMVVMLNAADMERQGIRERAEVALETVADDGISRRVEGLQALAYDVPEGSCWAYYPECNPLIPLWHHAEESKTPAAKSVPVRVVAADSDPRARPN